MLFVTNTNGFHYKDRYDGVDYEFPPNRQVAIEEAAATHIFAWGQKDKSEALLRAGWANKPDGARTLANFRFTPAKLVADDGPKEQAVEAGADKPREQHKPQR